MVDHALTTTNGQLATLAAAAAGGDTKSAVWLPSDIVILARKLRLTPYHGGNNLSILDFVSLVHVKAYLELLDSHAQLSGVLSGLANILEWLERIQKIGEWQRAIDPVKGAFSKTLELGEFSVSGLFDVKSKLPNDLDANGYKILQERIRAPRNWVTNKQRNHHVIKTPYEDLVIKLDEAGIQVPKHELKVADLEFDFLVPWNFLPRQLDPAHGALNENRALRKRQQISNIIHYVSRLLRDDFKIVDFCGGGGHISLVLAWIFPKIHVTLLDKNEVSLALAQKRKQELGLTNLEIVCSDVEAWQSGKFDVGVAIHACGSLSDIIMEKCIAQGACYVLAPCCFGALQNADTELICLPRSSKFSEAGVTKEDYMSLSSVADVNTSGVSLESTQYLTGKRAMSIIDHDRNLRATQNGYSTFQFTMKPPTCTPKNEIICGISPDSKLVAHSEEFFDAPITGLYVHKPE